tara:strand:- start:1020 stop:2054 length:1035 start_codon:yes stop_codon:yes gene_type:complete
MQKDRNFLGIWIPKNVYLNNKLSWLEKILLVEIESLDNERGCFASNDYFADFLGVTKTTISTSISKLKRLGFVEQVSFDGRTRVIKVIRSEFKKPDKLPIKKVKVRVEENLKHNKTINNTSNNTIIKDNKINNKKDFKLDLINVIELKNNQAWIESIAMHLKLSPHFLNNLLKEFIAEQILKDDDVKSLKEQKSHFLNWSKLQVAKNRKLNDAWGRSAPAVYNPKPNKPKKTQPDLTDKEKKDLHYNYLKENLILPYNNFVDSGAFKPINDFGSLISNELKKHGLLIADNNIISKTKTPKNKRGGLSNLLNNKSDNYNQSKIIKLSFEKMRYDGIKLENYYNEK